jgi:two-component system, NarL family, sensor histidine kinase DegS
MSNFIETSPKDEMVDMITREVTNLKRRLSENKDQIDSMQSSVEREQNRYTNIATELRVLKENLDTTPREDIRDKYDEALDVRFRLATMRGQLEKFEGNYQYMQEQVKLLQQVLSQVQGVDFSAGGGEEEQKANVNGSFDIIGLIRTQEEERERLARALHDGPAQSLTNFILQAEICQRLFDRNPDRAAEELGNLKTNASKTFQKVRDFIFDLRPMMLGDLGVAPTVRRYVESFREKNDIEVKLNLSGDERRLETYREVMVFRGLQDVMGLARDYASPTEMDISLDMAGKIWRLSIEDNGRGFDASAVMEDSKDETYNDARVEQLHMLKNRWEMTGGTLEVTSDENNGTRIRMELPTGE